MTKLEGDASLALATKRKGRWQTGIEVNDENHHFLSLQPAKAQIEKDERNYW